MAIQDFERNTHILIGCVCQDDVGPPPGTVPGEPRGRRPLPHGQGAQDAPRLRDNPLVHQSAGEDAEAGRESGNANSGIHPRHDFHQGHARNQALPQGGRRV